MYGGYIYSILCQWALIIITQLITGGGGYHLVSSELIDAVKPEKAIKPEMDQTKRLTSNKHLQEGQVVGLLFGYRWV